MRTYGAMLRLLLAICFLLPATAASALAKIPAGAKVAVMPIGAYGDATVYNAGAMATEYVMAALKKESSYELYDCDPEIVADRLAEMHLSFAGLTENAAAVETAKLFDADYVVRGNILSLGASHSDSGVLIYAEEQHTMTAHISLRIVNVRTGEIVMASKGEGKSSSVASGVDVKSTLAIASMASENAQAVSGFMPDTVTWGGKSVSTEDLDKALRRATLDAVQTLLTHIDGKERKK